MTALAIHPSPSARRLRAHAPGATCPYIRGGRARRHLSAVPGPVEQEVLEPMVPEPVPSPATPAAGAVQGGLRSQAVAPAPAARLRLTTRGRRVFVALGFVLAVALGGGLGAVAYTPPAVPSEVDTVVVQPGQSLWVIADGVAGPGQDVREVIEQIRTLNSLEHSTVVAGQELAVPAG